VGAVFELGKFLVSLIVCQLAGIIGFFSTRSAIQDWYSKLIKPSFAPPNSLFGPVWVTLYFLMGIALYLVWRQEDHRRDVVTALRLFVIQLILNALWSPAFFGLRSPLAGLLVIVPLLVFVFLTTVSFFRISRPAGILMIPYLLWVGFATILNASIWMLNR
jgi:tryptophan-rich sensory protein